MSDWYYRVSPDDDTLEQGDLLLAAPILVFKDVEPEAEPEYAAEIVFVNCIILSQTCDLVKDRPKVTNVIIAPYMPFESYTRGSNKNPKEVIRIFEEIRKGNNFGAHMLRSAPELNINDELIVDFRHTAATSYKAIRKHVAKQNSGRLRLKSPYKEHLSQAFARFVMRVGLPSDIPSRLAPNPIPPPPLP